MANLIGPFSLLSSGEALVIITGSIELPVSSMVTLVGVVFTDLMVNHGLTWQLTVAVAVGRGITFVLSALAMSVVLHRSIYGRMS